MSRHRQVHRKPARLTLYVAAGTILAATFTATALAVGPSITSQPAISGSLGTGADLAGAAGRSGTANSNALSEHARAWAARAKAAAGKQAASAKAAASHAAPQHSTAPKTPTGTPQQIADAMLGSYGWPQSQFGCLNSLWIMESGWNPYATNPSSGAYGIPQSLPASKMASAGADWQTNPVTQIRWGLSYIKQVYGTPCGAWAHETAYRWY